MRVLVTGATGKVGNAVARALVERGDEVRAVVRDPDQAAPTLPDGIELVRGDVTDRGSLDAACAGRELVFNAMGLPEQWFADDGIFERVNALGSESVVRAAAGAGVSRVVHTSTIDVFHADRGARFDETVVADYPKGTAYERSKQRADELVLAAARETGIELVIANPAAVYGPGPEGSASLERDLLVPVVEGRRADVPALPPGGFGIVFNTGVASGHLLAAERGRPGERYILCDRHVTLAELCTEAVRVAGRGKVPSTLPVGIAKAMAAVGAPIARLTGKPPLMPKGQLHFFLWNAAPDSAKAQRELGWTPTPLDDGLRATLASLGVA
jgi:nucleoside-diphosphate-sugar epimerase